MNLPVFVTGVVEFEKHTFVLMGTIREEFLFLLL